MRRTKRHIVSIRHAGVIGLLAVVCLLPTTGCFAERSFPMRAKDAVMIRREPAALAGASARMSARAWVAQAQPELQKLLPRPSRPYMVAADMVDSEGRTRDVYAWFGRRIDRMQGLTSNWWALQHTAQSIEQGYFVETPAELYPGFEAVWIPVAEDVSLAAFVGFARDADGRVKEADCIVLLSGLWGDNGAKRNRDLSLALQSRGFHVLSLEQRGAGQTEARYPDAYCNYGVLETQDLMKVSEWLLDRYPHVRRTGIIGFCWGANQALLAAWYDGTSIDDDPSITENVRRFLEPLAPRRHFEAGIIAFSPVLRWEDFLDRMDTPRSVWHDPSPALFQQSTRDRMIRKRFPEVSGSLRRCIAWEFAWSQFGTSFPILDGYRFLRLLPYRDQPDGEKLEKSRVPVLIVHSVNDPLQNAQDVADLVTRTRNPDVAGLILPGGGHIGFQAWSRPYFYSLILNFFDPQTGAAAGTGTPAHAELRGG